MSTYGFTDSFCGLRFQMSRSPSLENIRLEIRNLVLMSERRLFLIAGCNGAGKTTATYSLLPDIISCSEFVNADEIARGLSPFLPEKASVEAGRIMLARIDDLTARGETFAFESTLSGRIYLPRIREARRSGYLVVILFFWLQDSAMAKERVVQRIQEGGHGIPPDVVERRYHRGIRRLFDSYLPECDAAFLIDNSAGDLKFIAQQLTDGNMNIIDKERFHMLQSYRS